MVRRKGELSKYAIDTDWPHQVALPTPIPQRCLRRQHRAQSERLTRKSHPGIRPSQTLINLLVES